MPWGAVECLPQGRQHGQPQPLAGLLLDQGNLIADEVVPTHVYEIATPLAGVEREGVNRSRRRSDGPMDLKPGPLVVCPGAVTTYAGRIPQAMGWIVQDPFL